MAETIALSIPRETVNDETGRILSWKVPSGSLVEKDELVCEVETSKVVLEIHAPAAGRLRYSAAVGEELPIGADICYIVGADENDVEPVVDAAIPESVAPAAARLSAAARRAAAQYGIDVSSFPAGTLVRRSDVLRKAGGPLADRDAGVPVRWADLPRRKLLESRILRAGQAASIQSSVTSTCRAGRLLARMQKLGLATAGLQPIVIFETGRLLKQYEELNAIHQQGRIGQYQQINIGWALDGGYGLVVPVIERADERDIHEIAAIMQQQLEAYLEQALSPAQLRGGTFTVTDLSSYGASFFQPLIAEGQSAILGIGGGPPWPGDEVLTLTLAFDHQLSEGKRAARFLQDLAARLEEHGALASPADETEPHCMVCQRDRKTLQEHKLILLRSEVPPGLVCSLCVAGW